MFPFLAIIATTFDGFLAGPWWLAIVGAAGLFTASPTLGLVRSERGAMAPLVATAFVISAGHAVAAAGCAYALGYLTRFALL